MSFSVTELVFLENSFHSRRSYRLEDFFWTGSGDGPSEEDKTTVYETKTILSTVYVGTPSTEAVNRVSSASKRALNIEPTNRNS